MNPRGYALVVGEALVDVVSRPDDSSEGHPGGSPMNVAFGLGRLGRAVRLVTQLGDDDHGRLVRRHLSSASVSLEARPTGGPTATARAVLDAAGRAEYSFDIHWSLDGGGFPDGEGFPDGDAAPLVVHTGSIAAVLEPGAAAVAEIVRRAGPLATVTFDPNIRPALIRDRPAALARIGALIRLSDVVKASDEDLEWIEPGVPAETVARRWLGTGRDSDRDAPTPDTSAAEGPEDAASASGGAPDAVGCPALVVITRGRGGATAFTRSGRVDLPAPAADVVDTIGAGDSYMSALIDALWDEGLLGAGARPALRAIGGPALRRVLRRASAAAAITVSRAGALPPTRAEL